ncbi:hypothetical protein D3C76_933040 [compost metagenome]
MVDDADVAAQLLSLFQIMGGEDDGDAFLVQLGEEAPHRTAQLDIDPGGRLVENQQARLMDQRPGNHQPTLHAPGQRTRLHIALVPQAQLGQVLLGAFLGQLGRDAVVTGLGHDDVEGLLELVEVELLGHHAQAALERRRFAVQIVAKHIDAAAGLVDQGREDANGGGFAGTVGAEQSEEITFGDVQINALEGLKAVAVGFGQLSDGQGRTHSGSRTDRKVQDTPGQFTGAVSAAHGARAGRTSTVMHIDNDYRTSRGVRSGQRRHHRGLIRRALLQAGIPRLQVAHGRALDGHFEPGIGETAQWDVAHADLLTAEVGLRGQGLVGNGQQLSALLLRSIDRHPVTLLLRCTQQAPEQRAERAGKGRGGPVHPFVRQSSLARVVQVPALGLAVLGAQVADDGVGLPQYQLAVLKHRHQAVGIA